MSDRIDCCERSLNLVTIANPHLALFLVVLLMIAAFDYCDSHWKHFSSVH